MKRLLLAATFSGGISHAQPDPIQLPAAAHGSAAISALGNHLPAVAKAYGLQPQELVTLFRTQPALGVDRGGVLLVACDGLAVTADGKLVDGSGGPAETAGPDANALTVDSSVTQLANGSTIDAFRLHSLPGVKRVILLDFDGHVTAGTSWNSSYTSGAAIASAPFDLDGDPTTFNATERAMIQKIWQRVAEDYAPFGVDVTTEDPGVEGLRRIDSADTAYGIRVVISPTNWYNTGAGGVAYIGAFNWNSDTPCFAFTAQLANGEKYIAEAVAHEVGHTLGLYHDGLGGTTPTSYYQGQGNWAPIMGVGYYKSIVQFSKGEYANANNLQDDLAVIATYLPLAADDHGNTRALATILSGPNVATGGTIETRGDVDLFRFDAVAGAVTFTLKGPAPDANLDLKVELLDADENVLLTSDLTTLSATIATTVTGGTYYLRVDGIGVGDPVTTGYSDYGSIGNYILTGSFPSAGTKQTPVAAITVSSTSGTAPLAVSFSGLNSTDADGTISSYQWNFGNGTTATGATASATYSAAGTYAAVLTVVDNDGLAGTATISITVSAPANVPPTAVATASTTSGTAPVPVTFSSAGSSDPDGSIAGYKWDFGDGTTSTAASPSKTFSAPGNYAVKLTVTDNAGASASSAVTVSVLGSPDNDLDVYGLLLSAKKDKAGTTASAAITILDRLGRAVAGATVTVAWSGAVGGTTTGKTDAAGKLLLSAQRTKRTGTATATITSVTAPAGGAYVASLYAEPLTKSITLP
ncbi:PKD domain-containing protein [Horticoccus sp. 23ND18S-11]|uniref:PKD domain-containing protein n=1 Tax=Horticoccus sp. 23ND18S-11 TaxID=3391832 RepID=UPI0039C99BB7